MCACTTMFLFADKKPTRIAPIKIVIVTFFNFSYISQLQLTNVFGYIETKTREEKTISFYGRWLGTLCEFCERLFQNVACMNIYI